MELMGQQGRELSQGRNPRHVGKRVLRLRLSDTGAKPTGEKDKGNNRGKNVINLIRLARTINASVSQAGPLQPRLRSLMSLAM